MKLFSCEHIFKHPWESVSAANWKKYPNEITPHVVHVDYLSRKVDPETGIMHTERLLTCSQNVPAFISRLTGGENMSYVYEKSEVDPDGKKLVLRSKNLTLSHLMTVEEVCTYESANTDTVFRQEARIASVVGCTLLKNTVEDFCIGRFQANAAKGRAALEQAIERIYSETKDKINGLLSPAIVATKTTESEYNTI